VERWEGQTLSGWPRTQQPGEPGRRGPKAEPHTRSSRRHTTPFQEVPSTRTKSSMGVEPTHLLGVLQRGAAHTRLTEASRPNKGVRKAAQAIRSHQQCLVLLHPDACIEALAAQIIANSLVSRTATAVGTLKKALGHAPKHTTVGQTQTYMRAPAQRNAPADTPSSAWCFHISMHALYKSLAALIAAPKSRTATAPCKLTPPGAQGAPPQTSTRPTRTYNKQHVRPGPGPYAGARPPSTNAVGNNQMPSACAGMHTSVCWEGYSGTSGLHTPTKSPL
jgi:hypothetical protein